MRVRVGARTDVGRVRERNEDAFLVHEPLFAVADGMGGHRGGDVASSMALEALQRLELPPEGPLATLVEEIKRVNREVLRRGESDRTLQGMGTTLTALLRDGEKAHVAHVGDSRAYLLRDGRFQRLTSDHTLVERMVQEGRIEADQARFHPQRSVLTRALGVDADLPVDELTLPIQAGDRVLLCTDGLTGLVDDQRISGILHEERDPQVACDLLVEAAIGAGGDDNVTVVILDFVKGDGADPARDTVALAPTRPGPGDDAGDGGTGARGPGAAPASGTGAGVGPGASAGGAGVPGVAASRNQASVGSPRAAGGSASPPPFAIRRGEDASTGEPTGEPDAEAARRPGGIRLSALALWTLAALIIVGAAFIGVRLYLSQQWYVGEAADRVAIYNGIPTVVLGLEMSSVEETTDLSAEEAMRLAPWRGLSEGITASSLEDARSIVGQIRDDVRAARRAAAGRREPTGGGT